MGSGPGRALRVPPSTAPQGALGPSWAAEDSPKSSDRIRGVVEIKYPAQGMCAVREIRELETRVFY